MGYTTVILCKGGTWDTASATFTGTSATILTFQATKIGFRWRNQILSLPKPVTPGKANESVVSGATFIISGNTVTLSSVAGVQAGMAFITGGNVYMILTVNSGASQITIQPYSNSYPVAGSYTVKRNPFNMTTNFKRITETVSITGILVRATNDEIYQQRDRLLKIAADEPGAKEDIGLALRPVAAAACDTRYVNSIAAITDIQIDDETPMAEPSYSNMPQKATVTLTLQKGLNR